MDLNRLAAEIYQNNVKKGFWDDDRSIGEVIALIHSEASEALEDWRDGRMRIYAESGKPVGFPIELADIVIRVLDLCHKLGIDIEDAIRMKHEYNLTRARLHGREH